MNEFIESVDTDEFSKEVLKSSGRNIKKIRIVSEEKIYVNNAIEHSVCSIKNKLYDIDNFVPQPKKYNLLSPIPIASLIITTAIFYYISTL
jgi:hypothetical protein